MPCPGHHEVFLVFKGLSLKVSRMVTFHATAIQCHNDTNNDRALVFMFIQPQCLCTFMPSTLLNNCFRYPCVDPPVARRLWLVCFPLLSAASNFSFNHSLYLVLANILPVIPWSTFITSYLLQSSCENCKL